MSEDGNMTSLLSNLEHNMMFGPGIFAQTAAPVKKADLDAIKKNLQEAEEASKEAAEAIKAKAEAEAEAALKVQAETEEKLKGLSLVSGDDSSDSNTNGYVPKYRRMMSREDMISLLHDMDGHKPIARKISKLAHRIVMELEANPSLDLTSEINNSSTSKSSDSSGKENVKTNSNSSKKSKTSDKDSFEAKHKHILDEYKLPIDFVTAADRIKAENFPIDPFEKYGLSEQRFQDTLHKFAEDQEVMELAERILPKIHAPPEAGADDDEDASYEDSKTMPRKDLNLSEVCKVHEAMIAILSQILQGFQKMPLEIRHQYSAKQVETTAELLVSICVEKKFKCVSDDVESALVKYENQLSRKQEFAACSQMLTTIMQQLTGCAKPRLNKSEFVEYLEDVVSQTRKIKKHINELYDGINYKSGSGSNNPSKVTSKLDFLESYVKFDTFTSQHQGSVLGELLLPMELREHYDAYKGPSDTSSTSSDSTSTKLTNSNINVKSKGTVAASVTGTTGPSCVEGGSSSSDSTSTRDSPASSNISSKDESEANDTVDTKTNDNSDTSDTAATQSAEATNAHLKSLWDESGAEVQTIMQIASLGSSMMMQGMGGQDMMGGGGGGSGGPFGGGGPGSQQQPSAMTAAMANVFPKMNLPSKKIRNLKPSDVVDMQDVMVQELKKYSEMAKKSIETYNSGGYSDSNIIGSDFTLESIKDHSFVGLIQALGSCGVERKYNISSEEMAVAGFLHAPHLQQNKRFINSTMEQQQILMMVAQMANNPEQGCSMM